MKVVKFHQIWLDACAEFWWGIYRDMMYVHRPDGFETLNSSPIGPRCFVKHLNAGLSGRNKRRWCGEVNNDSIVLAVDGGKVEGILVSSIDTENLTANILSAYMHRTGRGRQVANEVLSEALDRFRRMELHTVVAGPNISTSLEVECPIHLALLDEGFAWEHNWVRVDDTIPEEIYGVYIGGSLEGFRLQPEIHEKIEELRKEGIVIERVTSDQFPNLRRLDTGKEVDTIGEGNPCAFVAFVDGFAVGWTFEVVTWEDEGRIMSMVGPEVIPSYRRKGIGKVVHHLGTEEVVKQGAVGGWTATGRQNPAGKIYQSVGYQYWYTCFNMMTKQLR